MAVVLATAFWEKFGLALWITLVVAFVVFSVLRALDDDGPSPFSMFTHAGLAVLSVLWLAPWSAGLFAGILVIELLCWGYNRWGS